MWVYWTVCILVNNVIFCVRAETKIELFNYVISILYYNNDDTLASIIVPDFIDDRNESSEIDTIIFQL